jgi:hypothetical protein
VKSTKEKMLADAQKEIDEVLASLDKPELKMHEVIAAKKRLNDLKAKQEEVHFSGEVTSGTMSRIRPMGSWAKSRGFPGRTSKSRPRMA